MSRHGTIYPLLILLLCTSTAAYSQQQPANNGPNELAYRAALGRGDDVALLLRSGANANSRNSEGLPLLLVAAGRKDPEALAATKALIEGGADVNAKDSNGQTALYYAARNGRADVVGYLLEHKIDYYSKDNNGDIARTIAFRAGHLHIVNQMDDYVKKQTLQVQQIYANAEEQRKAQEAEAAKEAARLAEEEAKRRAQEAEEEAKRIAKYKENLEGLDSKIYDISYQACAFEYWSFVKAAEQTTPLSPEMLEERIQTHAKNSQDASLQVMEMFETDQNYVNRIILPSKQLIFNELNGMPSATERKEIGVGTLKDAEKRCDLIAKGWQIHPPEALGSPTTSSPPRKPIARTKGTK